MVSLDDVHKAYGKYFHMEQDDYDRLDANLATAISIKLPGLPLWLINVAGSGGNKSGLTTPFIEWERVHKEHTITANTLVSGKPGKTDLVLKLKNKVLYIQDMAQLLTLHPNDKAKVWAQLRDLYDGYAGKSTGMGKSKNYDKIYVNFIGNATEDIDVQILIHSSLGTRELLYRHQGVELTDKLMDAVLKNEDKDKSEVIKQKLGKLVAKFCNQIQPINLKLSKQMVEFIKNQALLTTKLRAIGKFSQNNELVAKVIPELPTRVLMQFSRMSKILKNLDKNYSDETVKRIIEKVSYSSAPRVRLEIYNILKKSAENEANLAIKGADLATAIHVGHNTIKRECTVLAAVGLINGGGYDGWKLS